MWSERWRAGWWALRALAAARAGLRTGGVDVVRLPVVPAGAAVHARVVAVVLRVRRASCLESALVRQALCAAAGARRELVIGVTAPRNGFAAHAWLEGDGVSGEFVELMRRRAP